jgi:hypothetical protein
MKTYLLKLLFKAARLGWSKYADSRVPDYTAIHRQWAALAAGFSAACPIVIAVLVYQLFKEDFADMAHAGHAPGGAILMLLMLAVGVVILLVNHVPPILAVFVLASLAYDLYKLQKWRNSKFIALCIGTTVLVSAWSWLAMHTDEILVLSLADMAPFLSSTLALLLTFTTLMLLPKPRTSP